MRTRTILLLGALIPILWAGCAWVPQHATLQLDPRIAASTIGQGHAVALRVSDRRPSTTIGYRGVDSQDAAITTSQDVAGLFREKISEGLARKGFQTTPYEGQPGRLLTVEIHHIDYTTDMEYWKGIIQVKTELRAVATRDGARFEQSYVGERKHATVEAPRAATNERLINQASSAALEKLFDDQRLLMFLAE